MNHAILAAAIGQACTKALVAEVSATPKPGLVDRSNSGAHQDMNFKTFTTSIAAIAPTFSVFAELGAGLTVLDEHSLLKLRPVGIRCEKAMFAATQGINTHKGAIFSLGILAAAAGHCGAVWKDLRAETVCDAAAVIAAAAQQDFENPLPGEPMTKGRQLYLEHGMRGIRGEAAEGFPSVRTAALPELRRLMAEGKYSTNKIHLEVLLHLMERVDDTNMAARGGLAAVQLLHTAARRILAYGGALTPGGMAQLHQLDRTFIAQHLSPGGCADLLSVTIALYEIEKQCWERER